MPLALYVTLLSIYAIKGNFHPTSVNFDRAPGSGHSYRRIKAGSHVTMPCLLVRSTRLNTDTIADHFEERNVIPSYWSSAEPDQDLKRHEDLSIAAEQREAAFGAQLIWVKDGNPILLEGSRSQDPSNMALTVRNVTKNDSGIYACAYVALSSGEISTTENAIQLIVEDVPDAPIDVDWSVCDGRVVQLQWSQPADNQSAVTEYIVEQNSFFNPGVWRLAKSQLPSRRRNILRLSLSPWGNYSFRVTARNHIGYSRPSLPTRPCSTPPEVPHINPRDVCTVNARPHTLVVSWKLMPLEEQNAPGFYYLVRWRRRELNSSKDYEEQTVDASTNNLTIVGQPIYKAYEIFVLAINEIGEAASKPRLVIGYSAEAVPLIKPNNFRLDPNKEVGATSADFLWDSVDVSPPQIQGYFKGYKIQFWRAGSEASDFREHTILYHEPNFCGPNPEPVSSKGAGSTHVYNLWPFANITAHIMVLNGKYAGPPSIPLTFQTDEGVPESPEGLRLDRRKSTELHVTWRKPSSANGVLIGYTLLYTAVKYLRRISSSSDRRNDNEAAVVGLDGWREVSIDDPAATTFRFVRLHPDTVYRFSVFARTKAGRGRPASLDAQTLPSEPPVAPNFTTVNVSKRVLNVTWYPRNSADDENPYDTVFVVQYRKLGEKVWMMSEKERKKSWLVIEGLSPEVIYEMRVIARSGNAEGDDGLEAMSGIQMVRISMKRDLTQPSYKIFVVDNSTLGVKLTDQMRIVSSFHVQYRPTGVFTWSNTTQFPATQWAVVPRLEPGRQYEIRVVTRGDLGDHTSSIQVIIAGLDSDAPKSVAMTSVSSANRKHSSYLRHCLVLQTVTLLLTTVGIRM